MVSLIAVVEDDRELQALYRVALTMKGYAIAYVAADADDAVSKYQRCAQKPDLVIMDRRLQGSSGEDAARRIVEADPGASILFATADADRGALSGLPGVVGVLQKPFPLEAMIASIERALTPGGESKVLTGQRMTYWGN